jgi:hypothetical protein
MLVLRTVGQNIRDQLQIQKNENPGQKAVVKGGVKPGQCGGVKVGQYRGMKLLRFRRRRAAGA